MEPPTKKPKLGQETENPPLWVMVKGGNAVKYKAEEMRGVEDVSDLLKMVKKEEKTTLGAVDVGRMKLYKHATDVENPEKAVPLHMHMYTHFA